MLEDAPALADASDPRAMGLIAFQRRRKQASRDRLLAAAMEQFCTRGYLAGSVEDIAIAAGVSRVTFYRHFSGKEALAVELYREAVTAARPRFLQITKLDFRDPAVVHAWLVDIFAADRNNRALLLVFLQATVEGGEFLKRAHQSIADTIVALGEEIPAFAADSKRLEDRRRWAEAWLLIYEIKDQSNHAALNSGIATDPVVVDILTDRFLAFVTRSPERLKIETRRR